jgi:hypothetical protein
MMEVISLVAYRIRKDGSSQLQMAYVKKLVPQGDKYLKKLVDLGFIMRFGLYEPNVKSYKYGFPPKYQSNYIYLPLDNTRLIRRFDKARIGKKSLCKQARFIEKLTIDDRYRDFINENFRDHLAKCNRADASAFRIINRDFRCNFDSTSGRFHSNITIMPKGLRQFLRINGQLLVNLDLKNSQPYFSTVLLTNPSKVAGLAKNPQLSKLLKNMKVPKGEDIEQYIFLVTSGQIYEFLMVEFAKGGISLTRGEAKTELFKILYSSNMIPQEENDRKLREIFKSRFPTVFKVFSKIKGSLRGDKFYNYKRFAILLQTIESHLILSVILKRVYKEIPKVSALTIHDSILTTHENAKAVRQIMAEELTSFIGHAPQIRIEDGTVSIDNIPYNIYQYDPTVLASA